MRKENAMSVALVPPAKLAPAPRRLFPFLARRRIACSAVRREARGDQEGTDPRDLGRQILDDFAYLKESYCRGPLVPLCPLINFRHPLPIPRRAALLMYPLPLTRRSPISSANMS